MHKQELIDQNLPADLRRLRQYSSGHYLGLLAISFFVVVAAIELFLPASMSEPYLRHG